MTGEGWKYDFNCPAVCSPLPLAINMSSLLQNLHVGLNIIHHLEGSGNTAQSVLRGHDDEGVGGLIHDDAGEPHEGLLYAPGHWEPRQGNDFLEYYAHKNINDIENLAM